MGGRVLCIVTTGTAVGGRGLWDRGTAVGGRVLSVAPNGTEWEAVAYESVALQWEAATYAKQQLARPIYMHTLNPLG